jgi:hypothetical protein
MLICPFNYISYYIQMSKSIPCDKALWKKAHAEADRIYKTHSAYKSGYIVKYYKDHGGKFKPTRSRSVDSKPLKRWFAERWTNQRGEEGYKTKSDVYRPSVRVSSKTPKTWSELTKNKIAKARKEKAVKGRVKKF